MGLFRVLQLIITGDSKSATRAIGDVGTASEQTSKKVSEHNKTTAAGFENVHKSASKVHDRIGMLGSAIGIGGLAFGIKDAVTAGSQWQAQQASLHVALRNTGAHGANAARQVSMLSSAAEGGSVRGGFAAPQELAALTQFTTLTHSSTQALKLNTDAMNLGHAPGLNYASAQRMVSQALTGNVGRLQRYLGIIQPVKTATLALSQAHKVSIFQLELQSKALGKAGPLWLKQQELYHGLNPLMVQQAQLADKNATATLALDRIQQRYGGQTAAYAGTAAGKMSDLKNSIEVMSASLGTALLPALTAVVGVLSSVASWMSKNKTATLILLSAVGALTVAWGLNAVAGAEVWGEMTIGGVIMAGLSAATGLYEGAVLALALGFEGMGVSAAAAWVLASGGVLILVAAVIAGVALIVTHWKWFKGIIVDVWHGIESVAKSVFNWIVGKLEWIINKILWIPKHLAAIGNFLGMGSNPSQATINTYSPAHMKQLKQQFGELGIAAPHQTKRPGYGSAATAGGILGAVKGAASHGQDSNPQEKHPAGGGNGQIVLHHTTKLGNRVITEEVVRFANWKTAASGALVLG